MSQQVLVLICRHWTAVIYPPNQLHHIHQAVDWLWTSVMGPSSVTGPSLQLHHVSQVINWLQLISWRHNGIPVCHSLFLFLVQHAVILPSIACFSCEHDICTSIYLTACNVGRCLSYLRGSACGSWQEAQQMSRYYKMWAIGCHWSAELHIYSILHWPLVCFSIIWDHRIPRSGSASLAVVSFVSCVLV